ncbi:MAG: DUF4381 domain-containing protein [Myxococcota bacterium]|nr:DUF4381 domain-containing protein [Myxococcota bacterium]
MAPTTDVLAALRDIHLPEAVAFWPLAPGWWALLAGALSVAAIAGFVVRRRRQSVRRAALRELDAAQREFGSTGDTAALAVSLSSTLRRVALARFARAAVAGLHGDEWLGFLAANGPAGGFPAEVGTSIERAVYADPRSTSQRDGEAWLAAARAWIRRVS